MKKIALDLQPCCGKRSGVGNVAYELARRMHSSEEFEFQGNVFNFLGRNDNGPSLAEIDYPVKECRLMPYGVYRRLWNYVPLKYSSIFGKADLSLFFNFGIPKTLDSRSIVYIHDFTYLRYPETMNRTNLEFISSSTAYSAEHADRIMVNSEFTKAEACELLKVPEEKISVIYPSLSFIGLDPADAAAREAETEAAYAAFCEKFGLEKEVPILLFVSTIEPRKNLVRLLKAFGILKEEKNIPHKLIIAGGKGWNNDEIFQTAEHLPCKEDVIFTGFISSAEKNALFHYADAFVFPSVYEGFGIPVIEAMSLGCPVVAAQAGSLPEVCGDFAEMTDPFSEESIAEGIYHVISDREYRGRLIEGGYIQAKKFSWDSSAAEMLELCRAVLAE